MPFFFKALFRSKPALTTNSSSTHTTSPSTSTPIKADSMPSNPPAPSSVDNPPPYSPSILSSSDQLNLLLSFLSSPLWQVPLSSFIDQHSISFTPNTEHSFTHTALHQSYVQLAESLLTTHLTLLSIPPSTLPSLLTPALSPSSSLPPSSLTLLHQLLTIDDYLVFYHRMVSRNVELDQEVLDRLVEEERRRRRKVKGGGERVREVRDEEEEVRRAMELSLMEEESLRKEREKEQADLDYAIALSLALQSHDIPTPTLPTSPTPTQPTEEYKEEDKTSTHHNPSLSTPSIPRASVSSPAVLAPIKGARRPSPPVHTPATVSESTGGVALSGDRVGDEGRADVLRQQRQLLIAAKRAAGEAEMAKFEAEVKEVDEEEVEVKEMTDEEMRRVAMMRRLKERLRGEAERTIAQRVEKRALDEQVNALQRLEL